MSGFRDSESHCLLRLKSTFQTYFYLCRCQHFVSQLPEGMGGANGRHVLLFVDGHTSRWSFEGLKYLHENHVIVFCLPSHTSIWSQVFELVSDFNVKRGMIHDVGLLYSAKRHGSEPSTPRRPCRDPG